MASFSEENLAITDSTVENTGDLADPATPAYTTAIPSNERESFMRISGEDRNKSSNRPLRPYSTTSSVYAEHTMSNPDNDQVIYCIGAIVQAQIFDDYMNPEMQNNHNYPEFNLNILLPAEYGGHTTEIPEQILNHETLNDLELRSKLIEGVVPTVDTIYRFLKMMITLAKYSVECNILALVYINRITTKHQLPLTMWNWRGLWVSAIILAQKVWDDVPLKTSSFAKILPNVTKEQLRELEMKMFQFLDYNTTVKLSVYAKYYFELRQLFKEISDSDPRFKWNMQPLTLLQGKKLEYRSQLTAQRSGGSTTSSHHGDSGSSSSGKHRRNPSNSNSTTSSASGSVNTNINATPRTAEDVLPEPTSRSRYVIN